MRKYDVVYILKERVTDGELRFSLRSIEANMTHGKVWFYCGCPAGIIPDEHVPGPQVGAKKWDRVRNSLVQICKNDDITEKFWLFNDDFYVLRRMTRTVPLHRGELRDHIAGVEARHGGMPSGYTRRLRACEDRLKRAGLTTLDYALHVPILVDRKKGLETLETFPDNPMFRSLYGNYAKIGGEYFEDVKTMDQNKQIPDDALFFSTGNRAFGGKVLEQLQKRFPEPCRYEAEYHG